MLYLLFSLVLGFRFEGSTRLSDGVTATLMLGLNLRAMLPHLPLLISLRHLHSARFLTPHLMDQKGECRHLDHVPCGCTFTFCLYIQINSLHYF